MHSSTIPIDFNITMASKRKVDNDVENNDRKRTKRIEKTNEKTPIWDKMDEKLKLQPILCLHCESKKYKFLQFANKNTNQPRFRCLDCGKKYTHGGNVHKKKTKDGEVANITLNKKLRISKAQPKSIKNVVVVHDKPFCLFNVNQDNGDNNENFIIGIEEESSDDEDEKDESIDDEDEDEFKNGVSEDAFEKAINTYQVKKMTNEEKEIANEVGEDYCFLEEYLDKDSVEVEELVFVEFVDEVELGPSTSITRDLGITLLHIK